MMITKLHCKFCHQPCLRQLPAETPPEMLRAFERHQVECKDCRHVQQYGITAATCKEGQSYDRFHVGYSWRDITVALKILKLVQATQLFLDQHGRQCNCSACSFAQTAIWNATEKEMADVAASHL